MNRSAKIAFVLAALLVALAAGPASAQSAPATHKPEPRVVALRRDPAYSFRVENDRFKRAESIAASTLVLPAKILQVSPKGYVLVEAKPSPVWLDKLDVDIDPKLTVKARCAPVITVAADTTTALTRGAGEGCK